MNTRPYGTWGDFESWLSLSPSPPSPQLLFLFSTGRILFQASRTSILICSSHAGVQKPHKHSNLPYHRVLPQTQSALLRRPSPGATHVFDPLDPWKLEQMGSNNRKRWNSSLAAPSNLWALDGSQFGHPSPFQTNLFYLSSLFLSSDWIDWLLIDIWMERGFYHHMRLRRSFEVYVGRNLWNLGLVIQVADIKCSST